MSNGVSSAFADARKLLLLAGLVYCRAERCGGTGGDTGGPCRVEGPATPEQQASWLASLKADRAETIERIGYSGGVFGVPGVEWTQHAFVAPQMHPFDLHFHNGSVYTADEWLDGLNERCAQLASPHSPHRSPRER